MSAPAPDLSNPAFPARRPDLRPWLVVLLPFAALGLLPWWVCLALSAALALGRLSEDSRSISALLALLAAVAVSLPLLFGAAPDRLLASGRLVHSGTLFAQAAGVGLLALASARALEHGQRRGLLLPAAALLLFPSPGGLAALLLAALGLSGAESRPQIRLGTTSRGRSSVGLALLGAVVLVAAVALLLGKMLPSAPPQVRAATPANAGRPHSPDVAQHSAAQSQTSGARQGQEAAAPLGPLEDQALLLRPLVPITALLIMVCVLLLLQRTRLKRAERRSSWTDYAAIVGMLGTLFMLGVLGAGAGPGGLLSQLAPAADSGSGGKVAAAASQGVRHAPAWITPLLNVSIVFATLFFAVAAVYLYLELRALGTVRAATTPNAPVLPQSSAPLPPLHRVRLAWRGLETALAAAGLARMSSETPEEYAQRLAGLLPAAAADLHTLTRLYLPVRYGGELSEADADQAEASAQHVLTVFGNANAAT